MSEKVLDLHDDRPFDRDEYDAILACEPQSKNCRTSPVITLQTSDKIKEKKKEFSDRYLNALYKGNASL